jgi:hypothetical protein
MATPQLVSEVMTKDVVSVSEDQTLADLSFHHFPTTSFLPTTGGPSQRWRSCP